jgi:hypothetical protein
MKTCILLLSVLVCLAPASAEAEVFIYKNKLAYTLTGGGSITKVSVTGWTVLDDWGRVTQVLAYPKQRKYTIMPMESILFDTVEAAGKRYSCFLQHDQWYDGFGHLHLDTGGAKGMNTTTIVNGVQWQIPKTFTWGGRSMYPASNSGIMRFEESSGRFTFDKKWTDTSNAAGDTLNTAAERLAASLEQQGYESF